MVRVESELVGAGWRQEGLRSSQVRHGYVEKVVEELWVNRNSLPVLVAMIPKSGGDSVELVRWS